MPQGKPNAPENPAKEPNKELDLYKRAIAENFNLRFEKLNEAARNATNVWDRLTLEYRIKELTDLYTLIKTL